MAKRDRVIQVPGGLGIRAWIRYRRSCRDVLPFVAVAVFGGSVSNLSGASGRNHPIRLRRTAAVTHFQMSNVDFHADENVHYRIRSLRGELLGRGAVPTFDDKRSFILKIDSGAIGVKAETLTY